MVSPNKTLNIPNVSTTDRNNNLINSPDGTFIFNTDSLTVQVKKGAAWEDIATGEGVFSLQDAYDNGPTINMDSNVDLQVFSSSSDLAFAVVEGGASSSVECLNTLKISYENLGGPALSFDHLTPTSAGAVVANLKGQTQATDATVKNYQMIEYKITDSSNLTFTTETLHKNLLNGNETPTFSTGIENISYRDLNMQNSFIKNAGAIDCSSLDSPTINVLGGSVSGAGSIDSQVITSALFAQFNEIEQTDPNNSSTLFYNIINRQPAVNANLSWQRNHSALNSTGGTFTYNREEFVTANVTTGSESGLHSFYSSSNGALSEYLRLDGAVDEVSIYKSINCNTNPINNVSTIQGTLSNKIDFNSSLLPGALVVESGSVGVLLQEATTGNNIGITAISSGFAVNSGSTNIRNTDGTKDILLDKQNGGNINLRGNASGFVNVQDSNLNLNANDILETRSISGTNGALDFSSTINQLKINTTAAAGLLLQSLTGQISINNKIIYIPDGQALTAIAANTTYVFLGTHTFTSTLTINQPGVVFRGTGRDNSKIQGAFAGALIDVVNQDFEIADLTLTASGDDTFALTGSNFAVGQPNSGRTKTLNMHNCQLRNCKNGMILTGFDLVDFSQTLFYYFEQRTDALAQVGVEFRATSKVELTSCEFLRWFDESTFAAPANFFVGDQVKFVNDSGVGFGAVNINGCLTHPQQNQNGVVVDNAATFGFANITSCSFIDLNLNTPTYQPLVIDIDLQPSWIIEANQGVPNYKAFINTEVDNNATVTTITAASTPTAVLASAFINNGSSRVTLNTSTGLITKDSKRSNYFSINLTGQFTIQSGGNNQNIEFGLLQNGTPAGPTTKVEADANVGANFTFNIIGFANKNDNFQLYCQNNSGANDILVNNLQLAGVES